MRKRYHAPATPCDRLLADPRTSTEVRRRIEVLRSDLDPVQLLSEIRNGQQALVSLTQSALALPLDTSTAPIPVADFLAGLRTAWQMGEVRPTAQPHLKPKRGRRRPDPLIAVTDDLRSWFVMDPSQTGSQLLLRLQASDPDRYPDALLRTVQRRLRTWRSEIASQLVFGLPKQQPAAATPGTYALGNRLDLREHSSMRQYGISSRSSHYRSRRSSPTSSRSSGRRWFSRDANTLANWQRWVAQGKATISNGVLCLIGPELSTGEWEARFVTEH